MDNNLLGIILAALIGALAGIVGAYQTGRQTRELERQKHQQELSSEQRRSDQELELERTKHAQELELERLRLTQELRVEYDKDVRQHRINAYKELWKITGRFDDYAQIEPINYAMLQQVSVVLRLWYFEIGGIYLTEGSEKAYFAVQKLAQQGFESPQLQVLPMPKLPPDDVETVRKACRDLRSQLLLDVGTRRELELN